MQVFGKLQELCDLLRIIRQWLGCIYLLRALLGCTDQFAFAQLSGLFCLFLDPLRNLYIQLSRVEIQCKRSVSYFFNIAMVKMVLSLEKSRFSCEAEYMLARFDNNKEALIEIVLETRRAR